jgi:hypothetical protein
MLANIDTPIKSTDQQRAVERTRQIADKNFQAELEQSQPPKLQQ